MISTVPSPPTLIPKLPPPESRPVNTRFLNTKLEAPVFLLKKYFAFPVAVLTMITLSFSAPMKLIDLASGMSIGPSAYSPFAMLMVNWSPSAAFTIATAFAIVLTAVASLNPSFSSFPSGFT